VGLLISKVKFCKWFGRKKQAFQSNYGAILLDETVQVAVTSFLQAIDCVALNHYTI
jgi:hypothetical protein